MSSLSSRTLSTRVSAPSALALLLLLASSGACTLELWTDTMELGTDSEGSFGASTGEDSGEDAGTESEGAESSSSTGEEMESASFDVRESVEQVHIWNAAPGLEITLVDDAGVELDAGVVDEYGGLVLRELPPGEGYFVEASDGERSGPHRVFGVEESTPAQPFYDAQEIGKGFGYLETRDGTKLSVYVTMPGPPEDGPYPTIINYSGYSPSKPGQSLDPGALPEPFELETLCVDLPILCDMPDHPSGIIGGLMGFATVGVNMRGTGCSGGAFDYFETLQALDGYDLVEAIAAQDWVANHEVATAGLSYPGISQMWIAREQPPSLVAISPLSIIADISTSTLSPGGIVNDGFALTWADRVVTKAAPYGQGWEQGLVDQGDEVCEENQKLHGQKVDTVEKALMYEFYDTAVDDLNPLTFVDKITVPVFTAGAWQDEQTGGHFPALWDHFTGAPIVRYNGYNGVHADGYTPDMLIEWNHFLGFYLRKEIPEVPQIVRTLAPFLFEDFFGDQIDIPPDRFLLYGSYEEALAAYEAEEPVRIIFEAGAAPDEGPGLPIKSFERSFTSWPIPELTPQYWYLQPGGGLAQDTPPGAEGGGSSWLHDPNAGRVTTLNSGDINDSLPPWSWEQVPAESTTVFLSGLLQEELVMIGPASADLWIRSTGEEADLEVTITEVRPDGQEMYVQSGWLRASHRAIDEEKSTALRPVQTHLERDYAPLVPGEWTELRVEIFPFGHVFRVGSRIRVSVDDPGNTRAEWQFILHEFDDEVTLSVGHSAAHPSRVVLPVHPSVDVPTPLPPCPSLRGQPCREFVEHTNTPDE